MTRIDYMASSLRGPERATARRSKASAQLARPVLRGHALPPLGSHDSSAIIMIAAMLTLVVMTLLMAVALLVVAEIGWLLVDPTPRGK